MRANSIKLSFVYILSLLAIVSCLQEERSPEDILVPSPAQVETSDASLMLASKVPSGSEKLVQECGFYYSKDKSMADTRKVAGVLAANNFTAELPDRTYGTTYYICAYVTNGHGSEIRSDLRTFQLDELEEYVEFGQVNMVSFDPSSKQLMITIDTDIWAGVSVSEAGVCYGTEPTSLSIEGDHKEGVYRSDTRAEAGVIEILLNNFSEATQYYLRPYVKDGEYLSYGEVVPFYIPAVAKVSTFDAEAVTASGATLSGEVTDECGSAVTERGFAWIEGDAVPTIEDSHMASGSGLGAMTATVEGLDPNKKYTFRAYATNVSGTAYGDVMSFTTKVALPALSSVVISSITSTSATISSKVANHGGETVVEVGFYYSTDESLNLETATKVSLPYSADSFSADIADLLVNTKYYVKSFAKNSAGIEYSELETFTTSISFPSVKTVGSSDITSTSALLSGIVVSDNGASITERGFVWLQGTGTPTTDSFKLKVDGEVGEYSTTLEGLDPNQKYSFRAYAINSKGTAYGEIMTFSTVVGLPVLSTVDVADITATSAIVTADVKDKGGESIAEVGFYYSTEETVDIESSVKVKKNYTGNAFSASLDELQIFADYYVKAYAVNSAGVAYSDVLSFKTLASTPVVNTVGASEITPTSAVLSGTVATDNGAAITERGFVYLKGTEAPTTSSNKVKVEGTLGDFTASLADLEPNQKYSYRAYAINAKGTSYGDIMNFSTSVSLPALSAMKVSSITTTSATFTCTVTNHGGETVSEVGFYYSKEESVDVGAAQKISEVYSSDAFTLKAEDLEIGQNYYVKAYVKNSVGEAYSVVVAFKTTSTAPSVSTIGYTKLSATSAELSGQVLDDNGENITERGFVWVKGTSTPTTSSSKQFVEGTVGDYTATVTDLEPNQIYSFRAYAINSKGTAYGDVMQLQIAVTLPTVTTNEVTGITNTTATSGGVITSDGGGEILAKGVVWSMRQNPTLESSNMTNEGEGTDAFTSRLADLRQGLTYYVRAYATNVMGTTYGEEKQFTTTGEIQGIPLEASNSFIISNAGTYTFQTVKGNSYESVGSVASAEVLWESFGTDEQPEVGSLVPFAVYKNGKITFGTPDQHREGNAVIAAKDASGTILWSWHIWMTDQPQEHIYPNNAGTMMDRNLGATSATPGDVGALGLLYQWGRKDPFLGSSSIDNNIEAKSTIAWPSFVMSDSSKGTIDYATEHPTTFITFNGYHLDWYFANSILEGNTRWLSEKTIYDPCPVGWRVPDGGEEGVWNISDFSGALYDGANKGMSFNISNSSNTWYPIPGVRADEGSELNEVGYYGYYWSVNHAVETPYILEINNGYINVKGGARRSYGCSVRCQKEGTGGGPQYDNDFSTSGARSLSDSGTANSYIVSNSGTYSIPAVKGNSSESVGSVASAEVLWETFGTDEKISKGGLLSGARYESGKIYFKTADSYREGNAVIAAKDASGTILWSWHIWLTDQPQEQVYYNKAGTMMDRNLGATSAIPGDVGALGLLYQWGRKDPFLGSSSISNAKDAESTIIWPSYITSSSSNGTIAYATEHPTTYIAKNGNNKDWYYADSDSTDDTRWQSEKTIYDPCPSGWCLPDGGDDGVWSIAGFTKTSYDSINEGISFNVSSSATWYPASGSLNCNSGRLDMVGYGGYYWSVTPKDSKAYMLRFGGLVGGVLATDYYSRAYAFSVRCQKE